MSFQNSHKEFGKFWPEHWKVSKIFTLMYSFWAKYIMFEPKKVQRSHLWWHWRVMQKSDALKSETDWWFEKWHEKFGKFSPEHLGVSKLGLCWGHFVQSRKGMTVLFIEELCVMEIKNNSKFKEELTCAFKNDTRNLANLHRLK